MGWLLLFCVVVVPATVWGWFGERFLSHTERLPADTLVVESWIQPDALHAAAAEFRSGGYRHLVITGGLTGSKGTQRRKSYAALAQRELGDAGIAKDEIITAEMPDVDRQRTHAMAVAVQRALHAQNVHPAAVNIFTAGAHARRSRLVYAKVFGSEVKVGAISWTPTDRTANAAWWRSSERTLELVKETVGYLNELLFNSGRGWLSTYEPLKTADRG
jgi:hypothetical protein